MSPKKDKTNLFRSLRAFRGLSQRELGLKVGKRSQAWVARVQAGRVIPCPKERRKIAKILGTQVGVLWPKE